MNLSSCMNTAWSNLLLLIIGVAFGVSCLPASLVFLEHDHSLAGKMILLCYCIFILFFLFLLRKVIRDNVGKLSLPFSIEERFKRYDTYAYAVLLFPLLGNLGFSVKPLLILYLGAFVFVSAHAAIIMILIGDSSRKNLVASMPMVSCAFFISGGCALIYQIVWQRVLLAEFGCNIESITIIVSVFMFGLGMGSLLGGRLSKRYPSILPKLFMICEALTGLFGVASITLIKKVGEASVSNSLFMTFFAVFALLFIPTLLMGATLPILVAYLHRQYRNVGKSVGILYFINTFGAAFACFVTADILFALFGKQTTVLLAAMGNFIIVLLVYIHARVKDAGLSPSFIQGTELSGSYEGTDDGDNIFRFIVVLSLSFVMGFVSLSQEILWFRAISYVSGGKPTVFAHVLGVFLLGIALGSLFGKKICERGTNAYTFISTSLTFSSILYFLSLPAISRLFAATNSLGMLTAFLFIGIVSFLMGGIFPVLCHYGIRSDKYVGLSLSWIYFANIVGSTTGPLLTGFVMLDIYSLQTNILYLCLFILFIAILICKMTKHIWMYKLTIIGANLAVALIMLTMHQDFYANLLERLHYKTVYSQERAYKYVVQNKSGIIAVEKGSPDIIYGGGVYDGGFSLNPELDANGITRAYMIAALHRRPENILMIGLSSGSWAKVITNYNVLKHFEIVEINPGYLKLISRYPDIAPLLSDPRVDIHVDDGRRWLNRNASARFDLIVMNTTFYWREGATSLLSEDFLRICKAHLKNGGVIYYNSTGSEDVAYTASHVFKYIVRVKSFVAASDSPFDLTKPEIRQNLLKFQHNDRPDLAKDQVIERLVASDRSDKRKELLNKKNLRVITDDNMATEFKK